MVITQEEVGCFNPFEMEAFFCPVCGSQEFTELTPYAGVWCGNCNAQFEVGGTCDGHRKLVVSCETTNIWESKKFDFVAPFYWTVIWQGDDEVTWLARTKDRQIKNVKLESGQIVVGD